MKNIKLRKELIAIGKSIILGALVAGLNSLLHTIQVNPNLFGGVTAIIVYIVIQIERLLPTWL